ncbi:MAG: transglycosylase SLT domain-containing protein [Patescibacteria group bacterium]
MFESEEQIIELMIEKEFSDVPIMKEIAECESGLDNSAIGKAKERGLFQVHPIWFSTMKKLGIDLNTVRGNIKGARHILETQGLSAWTCWNMVK